MRVLHASDTRIICMSIPKTEITSTNCMRTLIAGLVSAGLLVAFTGASYAQSRHVQHRQPGQYTNSPSVITDAQRWQNERAYERGDYYEHDSNDFPVGSKGWFDQKDSEGGAS